MYDRAKQAILDSSEQSSVYVGCDSLRVKQKDGWYARYSTVIIVHKDSNHGCQLFHQEIMMRDYGNMKQRLMQEVGMAIEAATEIMDVIGNRHLEIHLDLNGDPKHKSNVAVKEALGYVKGSLGIDAFIKPNSWAASHAADHQVRH